MKLSIISEAQLILTTSNNDLKPILPKAEDVLAKYLDRYGKNSQDRKSATSRYKFNLDKYDKDYNRFYFSYDVISNKPGQDETLSNDDERYQYYRNGKTGYKVYKSPQDAVESIEPNGSYGYRGMSWEEWQSSIKSGMIKSLGLQNFSNQTSLTFYGYTPDTGIIYAGSFAPMSFKATPRKPGVIIAVPRKYLSDHRTNMNIPAGEMAHVGPLTIDAIAEAYMLIATKSRNGKFDLSLDWKGNVVEGSRFDISIGYTIRKFR